MSDFSISEMQEMQKRLQDKYKDKWGEKTWQKKNAQAKALVQEKAVKDVQAKTILRACSLNRIFTQT